VEEWIILHGGPLALPLGFDPLSRWLHDLVQWDLQCPALPHVAGLLALVVVVAARVSGIRAALTAGVAVFVIGGLGVWEPP